jgi:hypothetical protein
MTNQREHDIELASAVEQPDGSYINEFDTVTWYNELGDLHREDGPAVVSHTGNIYWYLGDNDYSFDEWCKKLNKSDEDKMTLRLQYA